MSATPSVLSSRSPLLAYRRLRRHDEATAERAECGFGLLKADGVMAVENVSVIFWGPAQSLSQLRRGEPGSAHRAVDFELCGGQSGKPHDRTPFRTAPAELDFVAGLLLGAAARPNRSRPFGHTDLIARDKINLGIFWLKDDTLDEPDLLPPPDEFTAEIVENLERGARPLPQGRAELTGLMT
jgi:hypothetical protein